MVKNIKANLVKDLFDLIHHNFLSPFKHCCDYLVVFIITSIMFYLSKTADYLKVLTDEEEEAFVSS